VAKTVTLIRHAETNANAEQRWQGTTDSGISARGKIQIERLSERVRSWSPTVVYASDMPRTMETSQALGGGIPTPGFREFGVGIWEGLTSSEIAERYPEEWQAFLRWEDVAPGGGEQLSLFSERVNAAFDQVIRDLDDGGHAVIVAHGGVIWDLLGTIAGVGGGGSMIPSHNTGISKVTIHSSGARTIATFNDATHIEEPRAQFGPEGRKITFVRHGQSHGNVAGTWDASTDTTLTELGERQAAAASAYVPAVRSLFSSPMKRTSQTAEIIGSKVNATVTKDEGLVEMSFGAWEGLTTEQIAEQYSADIEAYESGDTDHLPRGGTGESLVGAGIRMRSTAERLAVAVGSEPYAAVSHGAAIRALAVNVLGIKNAGRGKIAIPQNTAMSSFLLTGSSMFLESFNVAPHLEA
jgi:broad specificity phosphatase PhoE